MVLFTPLRPKFKEAPGHPKVKLPPFFPIFRWTPDTILN